jgi:hypothetical protein
MATKPYTVENVMGGVKIATWTLLDGDDGAPFVSPVFADKAVQVSGTFGGASVIIEGSNYTSAPVYAIINDPQGSGLTFTTAGIRQVLENTYYVRPRISGGSSVSLVVKIQFATPTSYDIHVT